MPPVTGRQTGRRKPKLKFTSSLIPWFECVLVSRKWPQFESADRVSVAGRQRASYPGVQLGQKAARINTELQLVEAVPSKPTHSPVGTTSWKIWIHVGKRTSWENATVKKKELKRGLTINFNRPRWHRLETVFNWFMWVNPPETSLPCPQCRKNLRPRHMTGIVYLLLNNPGPIDCHAQLIFKQKIL